MSLMATCFFQEPARASSPVDEPQRAQSPSVPPPTPPRSSSPQLRNLPVSTTAANQPAQSATESSSRSTVAGARSRDQQNAFASSSTTNQHLVVPRMTNNQLSIENRPPGSTASNVDPDSPPRRTQVSTRTDEQPLQPLTIRITNRGVLQRGGGEDRVGDDESDGPSKKRRVGTKARGRSRRGRGGR